MMSVLAVSVATKTYVTQGLVFLALFEFLTAMYAFGRSGEKKHTKSVLWLHRIGGYVFLVYWLWPIFAGLDLLTRLSEEATGWQMDARVFHHAFFGVTVLLLLLLKISFIRLYRNFRKHSRLLGFLIFLGTLMTWAIAGWFWLAMMGTPTVDR